MPVAMIGAQPSMVAEDFVFAAVTLPIVTVGAVPVTGRTGFGISVSRFITVATPAMFA